MLTRKAAKTPQKPERARKKTAVKKKAFHVKRVRMWVVPLLDARIGEEFSS
jgi:hypothetical protein